MIIQWGFSISSTDYASIIQLPISFTNTCYHLVALPELYDADFTNFDVAILCEHKTLTNCLLRVPYEISAVSSYIVIGY